MSDINENRAKDSNAECRLTVRYGTQGTAVSHTTGTVSIRDTALLSVAGDKVGNRRPQDLVLSMLSAGSSDCSGGNVLNPKEWALRGPPATSGSSERQSRGGLRGYLPSLRTAVSRLRSYELSTPKVNCYTDIQRSGNQK